MKNQLKLLVFDSHPVQYRTPIWKAIHQSVKDYIHVVYATDCSTTGYQDKGFNQKIAWDEPLLEDYHFTVLNNENGNPLSGWNSLTGKRVKSIIKQFHPNAILLTGLNYRFDLVALWEAKRAGIPIHLRCETQDEAFPKSKIKKLLRSTYYKMIYRFINRFYYIGQLNKQHYLNHGVDLNQLVPAPYFTIDRFTNLTEAQKRTQKKLSRASYNFNKDSYIIGFSGKLIPKKNPEILFKMLDYLPEKIRSRVVLYFMGSGELQAKLMNLSSQYHEKYDTRTIFTGFVNQSQIAQHYLTMDMLILPSRQMGETWGLVVNEAMQAGCSIVVSNFVGCGADFKELERFGVFQDGDAQDLAANVNQLMQNERDFNWAREYLKNYSLKNCVDQILKGIMHETALSLNSSSLQSLTS